MFIHSSCENKLIPEKLSLTSRSTLNLLQEKPQFVMYMNFKNMRGTEFWKTNISDSLFNAEESFGSMLYNFRNITGVTISDGLDEMYFSNSWLGDNAVVLKGSFDRSKIEQKLEKDTMFRKVQRPDGKSVYSIVNNILYFFFKDNFTICSSNSLDLIDKMRAAVDTTKSGLLNNSDFINALDKIIYKDNFWMVTTEKTFIRGIFVNFIEPASGNSSALDELFSKHRTADSISKTETLTLQTLFRNIDAVSFSGKMKNELGIIVQFDCIDAQSADYVEKLFKGMIAISKISNAVGGDKKSSAVEKMIQGISVKTSDLSVQVNVRITQDNIGEFRKNLKLNKPD